VSNLCRHRLSTLIRERLSNAWACFTARRLVQTTISCRCRTSATHEPVQKQPFSTFAFKLHTRIEFAVPDVMSYRSWNFNKWVTYSQPILNNFYFACAETAVCELQLENLTEKFEFVVHDVLKDVIIVEFYGRLRPLLVIYLLRMRRKRPLFYLRFKIWSRNWVPRFRFRIGLDISTIEPCSRPLLVKFLLRMRRNGHRVALPVLDFLQDVKFLAITRCLGQFCSIVYYYACAKPAIFQLSVTFLIKNLKFSWLDSYSTTKDVITCDPTLWTWDTDWVTYGRNRTGDEHDIRLWSVVTVSARYL